MARADITPVLPIARQKFPRHSEGYLEFFCGISNLNLFLLSIHSLHDYLGKSVTMFCETLVGKHCFSDSSYTISLSSKYQNSPDSALALGLHSYMITVYLYEWRLEGKAMTTGKHMYNTCSRIQRNARPNSNC